MKLENLEWIIQRRIEKYYGDVRELQCIENPCCYNQHSFKILEEKNTSLDEIKNNKTFNFDFSKKIDFSYVDTTIYLTLDENWNLDELKQFIHETIEDENIIKSINEKQISLHFNSLQERHCFKGSEFGTIPYKKEQTKHKIFKNKLEKVLKTIGINTELCNFEIFM